MKDNKLFKISIAEIAVGAVLELLALAKVMGDSDILAGWDQESLQSAQCRCFGRFASSRIRIQKADGNCGQDERYAFISMKAKEAAFGIYLIITAVLCIGWMLLGNQERGTLAGMSICLLVLLYA